MATHLSASFLWGMLRANIDARLHLFAPPFIVLVTDHLLRQLKALHVLFAQVIVVPLLLLHPLELDLLLDSLVPVDHVLDLFNLDLELLLFLPSILYRPRGRMSHWSHH
jgi:hypothetical protein